MNAVQIGDLICLALVLIATWYFAIRPYSERSEGVPSFQKALAVIVTK